MRLDGQEEQLVDLETGFYGDWLGFPSLSLFFRFFEDKIILSRYSLNITFQVIAYNHKVCYNKWCPIVTIRVNRIQQTSATRLY